MNIIVSTSKGFEYNIMSMQNYIIFHSVMSHVVEILEVCFRFSNTPKYRLFSIWIRSINNKLNCNFNWKIHSADLCTKTWVSQLTKLSASLWGNVFAQIYTCFFILCAQWVTLHHSGTIAPRCPGFILSNYYIILNWNSRVTSSN